MIDLDGSGDAHGAALPDCRSTRIDLRAWGPGVRMACSFGRFRALQDELARQAGTRADERPCLSLYGSGDFHHFTLALLRRQPRPFNLLILDKHPDWVRGVPFLHCGTWLAHALRLPMLGHVFHVGGDLDFDNYFRWAAPWRELRTGRVTVLPAVRSYRRGTWRRVSTTPVRADAKVPCDGSRVMDLVTRYRAVLAERPLYVSFDKDVLRHEDAVVNWDSGHLTLDEACALVRAFLDAAGGRLAGMDVLGDWSPVRVRGLFRRGLHAVEHPAQSVDAGQAASVNAFGNRAIVSCVAEALAGRSRVA